MKNAHRICTGRSVAGFLVALLAVLPALPILAEETPPVTEPPKVKTEEELELEKFQQELVRMRAGEQAVADHHFNKGKEYLNRGNIDGAIKELRIAVTANPDSEDYNKALKLALYLGGESEDNRSVVGDNIEGEWEVKLQTLWIEILEKIQVGQRQLQVGNFDQAEQAFKMAHVRLQQMPATDERRESQTRKVEDLILQTKVKRSKFEQDQYSKSVETAQQNAVIEMLQQNNLESRRQAMMLRRAMKSRERRDFDQCILLCKQILKEHPANSAAMKLKIDSERERHKYLRQVTADRWDEEHKLLSEHIRKAMLPQLVVIEYPEDWHEIDLRRSVNTQTGQQLEDEPWRKDIMKKLGQNITTEFVDTEIVDVVQFLQTHTGINFILDPAVAGAGVTPVTMQVRDITLRNALDFIMRLTGLKYTIQDEAIYVSTTGGVQGNVVMKPYEVRDLTMGLTNFPGPTIQLPQPGGQGSVLVPEVPDENPPNVNELILIIQSVVEPETWAAEDRTIEELNGTMVVRQTPEIHDKIEELLRTLRNQRAVQIHVKVKFLQVENAMLEKIQFEWRDFTGPPATATNTVGTVGGTPVAFAPLAATGLPYTFGGYYNHNDWLVNAGRVGTPLSDFYSNTDMRPDGGLLTDINLYKGQHGLLARLLVEMVEKTRRGNVMVEPDLTLFSGQRAFVARMYQQSYISDYDVVNGAYDPMIAVLSYGTVLDVHAIASADRRYITMTLRPQDARVGVWRRFGPAVDSFPGGPVERQGNGVAYIPGLLEYPLMVPQMIYHAVQTTVTIPDGGSMLIGGMNRSSTSRAHTGVPFLSHIPFLGRLFSSNGRSEQELKEFIYVSGDIILLEEIEAQL